MGILLQLMFTSASPMNNIPSLAVILFLGHLTCVDWIDLFNTFPIKLHECMRQV